MLFTLESLVVLATILALSVCFLLYKKKQRDAVPPMPLRLTRSFHAKFREVVVRKSFPWCCWKKKVIDWGDSEYEEMHGILHQVLPQAPPPTHSNIPTDTEIKTIAGIIGQHLPRSQYWGGIDVYVGPTTKKVSLLPSFLHKDAGLKVLAVTTSPHDYDNKKREEWLGQARQFKKKHNFKRPRTPQKAGNESNSKRTRRTCNNRVRHFATPHHRYGSPKGPSKIYVAVKNILRGHHREYVRAINVNVPCNSFEDSLGDIQKFFSRHPGLRLQIGSLIVTFANVSHK